MATIKPRGGHRYTCRTDTRDRDQNMIGLFSDLDRSTGKVVEFTEGIAHFKFW